MSDQAPEIVPAAGTGRLRLLVKAAMMVVALVFIGLAARKLVRDWGTTSVDVSWGLAVAACVPLFLAGMLQALAWTLLVRRMSGHSAPLGPSLALFAASYMARYVPMKVGIVTIRVAGAPSLGLAKATVASSFFIEFLSWTVTGGALGCLPLLFDPDPAGPALQTIGSFTPLAVAFFALCLVALVVVDRARLPAAVRRIARLGGTGPMLPAVVPAVHLLAWACWGVQGWLLTMAVGADASTAAAGAGFYVLAPVAGFLAVMAPAGAGVREAILSLGLAPSVGAQAALAAAVLSRAVTLTMDLALWLALRPWRARDSG